MNWGRLETVLLGVTALGVVILVVLALFGKLVAPPSEEPGVAFAKGTAHCQSGSYNGITTGNSKGACKQVESDAEGNTIQYECNDGAGNAAAVNCKANDGRGLCQTTGSGSCGEFKGDI